MIKGNSIRVISYGYFSHFGHFGHFQKCNFAIFGHFGPLFYHFDPEILILDILAISRLQIQYFIPFSNFLFKKVVNFYWPILAKLGILTIFATSKCHFC